MWQMLEMAFVSGSPCSLLGSQPVQPCKSPRRSASRAPVRAHDDSEPSKTKTPGFPVAAASAAAVVVVVGATVLTSSATNDPSPVLDGATLFENNCAGCHPGGGNIIGYARRKTLKTKALDRNRLFSRASIVELMKAGPGTMPKYGERLSEEELNTVADFVLDQAAKDWK
mmetsp:Transcript_41008/g.100857  ORF Transcript_41008/g.100857 Transcript_41008/m.100857 type:complete len:170 (+) Transcript_41008:40-549(+)